MKKKFSYKFALKVLLRKLSTLTVAEAQWLFRLYGVEHAQFFLRGSSGKAYGSSAASLSIDWTWIKPHDVAKGVPTRFEGGPAGASHRREYYNGTLVTVLIDRIMLCHQRCGTPIAWLVRFDQDSTKSIWDQLHDRIPEVLRRFSTHPDTTEAPVQRTLFDLDNPVVEVINIGGYGVPIHENGVQGCVMPREDYPHPHSVGYAQPMSTLDSLYMCSGEGLKDVCMLD